MSLYENHKMFFAGIILNIRQSQGGFTDEKIMYIRTHTHTHTHTFTHLYIYIYILLQREKERKERERQRERRWQRKSGRSNEHEMTCGLPCNEMYETSDHR